MLHPPECIEAGCDATIKFSVQPTDVDLVDIQLKKLASDAVASTLISLPVSSDIYHIEEGKIIFPKLKMEDAGTYIVSCNGVCSGTFILTFKRKQSEYKNLKYIFSCREYCIIHMF